MKPDFSKGLVPVIIQDDNTLQVLMLGYMNEDAYELTIQQQRVTFFSRRKNRLWTKGETSGNFMDVKSIHIDCDSDTILIRVIPAGPICHTGQQSCFGSIDEKGFLYALEAIISNRLSSSSDQSYTVELYNKGLNKIAQKVGEEAVELVIEAVSNDIKLFKEEAADLIFHLLILLKSKGESLFSIEKLLADRHKSIREHNGV
jgi:phosphoribosyl-ATP pyrophosphohydrolase/phosphoribosyl-AMP cyclohydrolase